MSKLIDCVFIVAMSGACSGAGLEAGDGAMNDLAGDAAADLAVRDAQPDLPGWTPTDAGVACGNMTCALGQVCVRPCPPAACDLSGGVNCAPPYCQDVPQSCSGFVTCGCFASDPCLKTNFGTCEGINQGTVECGQCPI